MLAFFQRQGNQGDEVLKSIGPASQHDDADIEARDVLLAWQVLVRGEEHVILGLGQFQQSTIL